ncbi:MAG: fluoride efflux transporter CrcB [Thermostichales cyanobacterium BF4_bins_65]
MANNLLLLIAVAAGSIFGALGRYYITLLAVEKMSRDFPFGTLVVNLSGAFLIGLCSVILKLIKADPALYSLVIPGFLASYTTFSTYTLDTFTLFKLSRYQQALLYGLGSPLLGFLAVELGLNLGQFLF